MRVNDSIKKFAVSTFAMVMLFGFGMVANANAQGRYDQDRYGYGNNDDDRVRWTKDRTRQYAYLLGYHQSYSEGRDYSERGYRGNPKDVPGYRNDTNGFLTWMGYRDDYRSQYRRGYEDGFKDAQNGRARRYDRDDVERVLGASLKDVYDNNGRGNGRDRDYDRDNDRRGRDRDRDDDRNGRYNRQEIYRLAQQNGYQDGLRRGQEARRNNRRSEYDRADEYRNALRGYRWEYGDRNVYQQGYRDGFRRGYEEGYRNAGGNSRWPRWPF